MHLSPLQNNPLDLTYWLIEKLCYTRKILMPCRNNSSIHKRYLSCSNNTSYLLFKVTSNENHMQNIKDYKCLLNEIALNESTFCLVTDFWDTGMYTILSALAFQVFSTKESIDIINQTFL